MSTILQQIYTDIYNEELNPPWSKLSKEKKMEKITDYMIKNDITQNIHDFTFKNIKYNPNTKKIISLTLYEKK